MTMPERTSKPVQVILYSVMTVTLLLFLFPFAIALLNSFKRLSEILLNPLALPEKIVFSNYTAAWKALDFPQALKNTVIVTFVSVALLVLLTSMSSYWISRHYRGFSKVLEKLITGTALIPFATIMLPLVLVIRTIKLINTYTAGIITYAGIGFPLAYLIMRGAVKAIPLEMDEAATIDGYGPLAIYFRIIMPLMQPTIAAVIISDVFWIWNEFQIALIFLNTARLRTIQTSINAMFGQYSTMWDIVLAGLLISLVPIVVVFLFLQKYMVRGIMSGAVKG
jgi:raffinose/stachyose/melibiose transport system permease protein